MSATNRGSKRIESDFYATPESVIHKFLNNYNYNMNGLTILEPSAGSGNFCKVIKEQYPLSNIYAIETRQEEKENLQQYCKAVHIGNFLEYGNILDLDVIIGNPPYSLAQEFLEKCFSIAEEQTKIIMLLRTAFLESKKRHAFWKKHPVNHLVVLSERPSFTGKGTDATSYSFFVWDGSGRQSISVI